MVLRSTRFLMKNLNFFLSTQSNLESSETHWDLRYSPLAQTGSSPHPWGQPMNLKILIKWRICCLSVQFLLLPYHYVHGHVMVCQNVRCLDSCLPVSSSLVILVSLGHQQPQVNQSGDKIEENLAHSRCAGLFIQWDAVKALEVSNFRSVDHHAGHLIPWEPRIDQYSLP